MFIFAIYYIHNRDACHHVVINIAIWGYLLPGDISAMLFWNGGYGANREADFFLMKYKLECRSQFYHLT